MLSEREAAFIGRQRVARLATADARGRPHVIPVCFAYQSGCFYTPIDEKPKRSARLKRLRNIEANPQVALVLDEYGEDWSQLTWVLVQGRAEVVMAGQEHAAAVRALREKYEQYRSMALQKRPVIRVRVEKVVSWGAV